jgi:TP901 family phage tail tape measure protein
MAGVGVVAVFGAVIKESAKFNQQMSVVRSIVDKDGKMTAKTFDMMRDRALALGASTSFTAKEAGDGMEHLSRAGFSAAQVIKTIGPTLRMAEADSMALGTAAQVVAASLRQCRLDASKAEHITDVTGLGEAMKFAGASSKAAGQSFEHTAGAIGLLANLGIRGTLAGTALKNAILKLTKQSNAAVKLFGGKKGLRQALTDTNGKMRAMPVIINNVIGRLGKIKNEADRAKVAFEIFGLRGKAAMDAFAAHKLKDQARLLDDIGKKAAGTAKRMAEQRLDNLAGDWIKFKSAVSGAAIAMGSMLEPEFRKILSGTTGKGGMIYGIQQLAKAMAQMGRLSESELKKKFGKTIAGIALGIRDGFREAKKAVVSTWATVKGVFTRMSGGSKANARNITKMITKFVGLAAVMAPIVISLGAIGMAGGAMFQIFAGGFKMMRAMTSGWGIALLVLVHTLAGTKKKGETTFEHMARGVKKLTKLVYALTAPFRLLAKHLGTIPAILAAVGGYKAAKYGLGKAGAAMAGSKSRMGRMFGGVLGAAGRHGLPVYVTNFGEAPGGGVGGMGPGMGGAAAGTAARAGFWARMGYVGKGAGGLGAAGLFGGGKLVTGGTAAMSGAGAKTASLIAGASTAGMALGAFALAMAPAVAGLHEMGKAYTEEGRAATRAKLLTGYRKKQIAARKKQETEDQRRIRLGMHPKFQSLEYSKSLTWEQKKRRDLVESSGVNLAQARSMKQAYKLAQAGKAWKAYDIMSKGKMGALTERLTPGGPGAMTPADLKLLGLNQEMVKVLRAIQLSSANQLEHVSKGFGTTVVIDGKEIAVATTKQKNESSHRSGKSPGTRRADANRGQ